MLAGPESGLELRAFAAPRHDGIWDDVRKDIAAEAAKRGGTATEVDGEFGTELKVVVPVQTPDGRRPPSPAGSSVSTGRAGCCAARSSARARQEPDPEGVVEQAFRDVIVVRGDGPMAPRDMIPMEMPSEAVRADDAGRDAGN